jgi:hypothetical protein
MFFPERVKSIKKSDKVLEVGPGATPHPRSDVFLELKYESLEERIAQSGNVGIIQTEKPVIYYDGKDFPFDDHEFDYVICSHVLEHVCEPEKMIAELTRVSTKGYIEFPTIYYEFIWNFPEHVTILFWDGERIYYLSKEELHFKEFKQISDFYYNVMPPYLNNFVDTGKKFIMQGFEWENKIEIEKAKNMSYVTYNDFDKMALEPVDTNNSSLKGCLSHLKKMIICLKNRIERRA